MKFSLDKHTDRQLLQALHRLDSATVHQLCDAIGVTATAVRQRLARLQSAQLVAREAVRSGRGRPHHKYRLTEAGTRILGENYSDLALVLWKELQGIQDPETRERVGAGVRDALVLRYGNLVDGESLSERMLQLKQVLVEQGFEVETDSANGLPILRENNCPYPDLAGRDRSICELEQEVFERILGECVTLAQCCRDGDQCCEFHAATESDVRECI